MFEEDRLRAMSHAERHRLMRALAAVENADPGPDQVSSRRRAIVLAVIIVCCLVLAAWIGVLAVTLPRYYRSGGWRGAWVGFDLALLAAFAVTGWAAWRRRQVLIICLVVLATLLCCDAWFDVLLDARTKGFELSLLSALFVELPLAGLAILGARRLLHLNIAVVRRYEGETGDAPRLRQAKIIGGHPGPHLSDLFAEPGPRPGPGPRDGPGPASASAPGASDYGDDDGDADYGGTRYGNLAPGNLQYGTPDPGGPEPGGPEPGGPEPGGPEPGGPEPGGRISAPRSLAPPERGGPEPDGPEPGRPDGLHRDRADADRPARAPGHPN